MYQLINESIGAIKKLDAPRDNAPTPAAKLDRITEKDCRWVSVGRLFSRLNFNS